VFIAEFQTLETNPAVALWDVQKDLLKQRMDEVIPIYDELVKRAKAEVDNRRLSKR
jgi:hypothetical protein